MPVLMFWNVKKGSAIPYLQGACLENEVDILILAEDPSPAGYVESVVNTAGSKLQYREFSPIPSAVRFYSRLPPNALSPTHDVGSRISIRELTKDDGTRLLIAGVHLPSKMYGDVYDQYKHARELKAAIEEAEGRAGHKNSIVIGDLNMNPFEVGVSAFDGLHGTMDRNIARRRSRSVGQDSSDFFYNPMWSRMGDDSSGPPGTYFYDRGGMLNYYWNTFDQILIRPSLLSEYHKSDVKIVTQVGTSALMSRGRINGSISDHLPITIDLRSSKELPDER